MSLKAPRISSSVQLCCLPLFVRAVLPLFKVGDVSEPWISLEIRASDWSKLVCCSVIGWEKSEFLGSSKVSTSTILVDSVVWLPFFCKISSVSGISNLFSTWFDTSVGSTTMFGLISWISFCIMEGWTMVGTITLILVPTFAASSLTTTVSLSLIFRGWKNLARLGWLFFKWSSINTIPDNSFEQSWHLNPFGDFLTNFE